ncbi:DUF7831 domain-containing protein [Methylobacterium haplocladii]|uniref:DUF7831 domain-containing protein n=1 Tax=Methylobacterium haplocladii TaxID=1176176 RepID=A0A512IS98_9HYPH|nr:hypothetical protein [Methylobacterium haplocladii]GEP00584.1 hypothetical protein MHA02_29710 [Methylobacterium haplocladii]GJD85499.1 hypothetical protein HPGCJGGD_3388 [Methylobacterium haplocladii]GLS57732.1 hypothetical protein GCM10007887_03880 [Methylobacterium haplocladii]
MIRHEDVITREMVRSEPNTLFVFGDNLQRRGRGGQAKEMRGEPNAVGIPTKRWPSRNINAYFSDADFAEVKAAASPDLQRLADHLRAGGTIVWPYAGIGTGRAELKERAPHVWFWLFRAKHRLLQIVAEREGHAVCSLESALGAEDYARFVAMGAGHA